MTIREVQISDAQAVAALSEELGYAVTTEVMSFRLAYVESREDHVIYVACIDSEVVGWIDVGLVHHIQSGTYAEIGGLVVSGNIRNKGIGKQLVAAAEKWATEKGIPQILVRSQINRQAAHRFYLREGYAQTKISAVFQKKLEVSSK